MVFFAGGSFYTGCPERCEISDFVMCVSKRGMARVELLRFQKDDESMNAQEHINKVGTALMNTGTPRGIVTQTRIAQPA